MNTPERLRAIAREIAETIQSAGLENWAADQLSEECGALLVLADKLEREEAA